MIIIIWNNNSKQFWNCLKRFILEFQTILLLINISINLLKEYRNFRKKFMNIRENLRNINKKLKKMK